jgi:phytoene dehydrogenase-like protein
MVSPQSTLTTELTSKATRVPPEHEYDAIVIGAGPNGLAAAIEIARAGYSVCLYEANATIGGGTRSAELTLPGFIHDVCSAVHPLGASSFFFSKLPLQEHGLEFIYPPASLAHPFDDGTAILVDRSLETTAERLGRDRSSYKRLISPLVQQWDDFAEDLLAPIKFPRRPFAIARFGLRGIRSAKAFAEATFEEDKTRALFSGFAAHSFLSLDQAGTTAFGLILAALAHKAGWPIAKGGSQSIANALGEYFTKLGGEIVTNHRVDSLTQLPPARAILCDVTPRQLIRIAGASLPAPFRRRLERYRYGPAAFKMDWALSEPVPWKARECQSAATLHLGGSISEIVQSEWHAANGKHWEKPFLIVAQPSLFDSSRSPNGQHTLWAYCHVPHGSSVDMSDAIERQIERFAPGFRDCILARSVMTPADLERHNANLIGGDINGGLQDLSQMFLRPTMRLYSTPTSGLYLCSSSTPPGGGVHGLCGYHAAQTALRKSLR